MQKILLFVGFIAMVVTLSTACKKKQTSIVFEPQKAAKFHIGVMTGTVTVCFFCTNISQTESLIKQVLEYGCIFIHASLPSPLVGYPGALGKH